MDSDFKNVSHKKRKWISFISNEKGFNLPLGHPILQENYEKNTVEWKYVVLNAGKELKLDTPIYYSYFFLRFFFRLLTAFPYQLFCLSWPPPAQKASQIFLPYFTGVPQHLSRLLPLQNLFHAALPAFANCCWCLIRQHFYKKYHLSAAVPLPGHFTKEMSFYVHTVNG